MCVVPTEGTKSSPLRSLVAEEAGTPPSVAVAELCEAARERFGNSVAAVLFYGSCRRAEAPGGLYDLYVLLDDYRALPPLERWLARALAPNVYHLQADETSAGTPRLRAKCAVVSVTDFVRGTSPRWFHSTLWARFAQPVTLAYARDPNVRELVEQALARAVTTFLRRIRCLVPDTRDPAELWTRGLAASYATELRSETAARARELYGANADFFDAAARLVPPVSLTAAEQRRERALWRVRRVTGKLMSVARVLKSAYTFDGGLDYIVWKLERHSGRSIEVPDKVRKTPALHLWGFFWRLYREGVFR